MVALLTGCGKEIEEEPEPLVSPSRVVGEITSVHAELGFALFRRRGPGELNPGGVLSIRSLDGQRVVRVELSPEQQGRFHVVDLPDGCLVPRVGDSVVQTEIAAVEDAANF